MVNTLFLPELREMLAEHDEHGLREFCEALHPIRTAEFMEGLTCDEMWRVLQFAKPEKQVEIFNSFEWNRQVEMLKTQDEHQVARLVTLLSADDAVDLLQQLDEHRVEEILALVPVTDRRDIRRLQTFPEGTAGAMMTTEVACVDESLTVRQAIDQLSKQAEHLETIYYIYVTDNTNHLRGVVSARRLVSTIGKPELTLRDLMISDVVTVNVHDDQQSVAKKVAKYNLLAIPVIDDHGHMLGIITHDDVIDVVIEEAAEEMQRAAAVEPLSDSYLRTSVLTLSWKRGVWLTILFGAGLLTALALKHYEPELEKYQWLVWFIPLIIGSGGNSGSQSSTLVNIALAMGDARPGDGLKIVRRELLTGLLLGSFLGSVGWIAALLLAPNYFAALIIPITILIVVTSGTLIGGMLPVFLRRLGLDPALMSNPFIACINDVLGIIIFINVAKLMLG